MANEEVLKLHEEGLSANKIAEEVGVSRQKVSAIIKASDTGVVVKTRPEAVGVTVMSSQEYQEYSVSQGRTKYGGVIGLEVPYTIEELRIHINARWTPSMVLEKIQCSPEKLENLLMQLSVKEMRPKASRLRVNFKQDFFR